MTQPPFPRKVQHVINLTIKYKFKGKVSAICHRQNVLWQNTDHRKNSRMVSHHPQNSKKTQPVYFLSRIKDNISHAAQTQLPTSFFSFKMQLHFLKGIFEIFLIKVYLEINRFLETMKIDDQKICLHSARSLLSMCVTRKKKNQP